MKSIGYKALCSIFALALATLACATPDVSSLLNPMPSDDFSSDSSGWGTGTDSSSSVEYANGGLQMIVYTPYYVTWSTQSIESMQNVHVEVSVKNESTDPEALYGIVCNELGSTQSFYYVGISPDGYYAFIKSAVAQDDVFLKEGNSDLISAAGGSVRLGLDCGNGSMTLYVNGQQVDTVSDSTYTQGSIGLFAATDDQESGVNVTFDDYVVTKLGE
ncbi:MAG TPA: hypothetical protein PKE35_19045 [Anaerolineales bacterium]|nr:hypothetical protein [Anaerolineales bacterium]HMV96831.1 hypothetical protein [Anaerolineales bacterium]HMX76360.1 hypothetical protein [Anaerolineales bacterium]HNA56291.1 hypothetical protein [Anaerolineales bacterium]HNB88623.1 hypothetical protein [Anaerolineales bacterium]